MDKAHKNHLKHRPNLLAAWRKHAREILDDESEIAKFSRYISPLIHIDSQDPITIPLDMDMNGFLFSEKKSFLLLGESGSGKTFFCRNFERYLWKSFLKDPAMPIPLRIPLTYIPPRDLMASQNMIMHHLSQKGFSAQDIEWLKKHQRFIFILDGYESLRSSTNLYERNRFNDWKAKVIMTCRSNYIPKLGVDYRDLFMLNADRSSIITHYTEREILPFSQEQINDYCKKYADHFKQQYGQDWRIYGSFANKFFAKAKVTTTPLNVKLLLTIAPEVMSEVDLNQSIHRYNRLWLYQQYAKYSLTAKINALDHNERMLLGHDPYHTAEQYISEMAYRLVSAFPVPLRLFDQSHKKVWNRFINGSASNQVLRKVSPIVNVFEQYFGFEHFPLMEFYSYRNTIRQIKSVKLTRNASFDVDGTVEIDLARSKLVARKSLLRFYIEHVSSSEELTYFLYRLIQLSVQAPSFAVGAANAITILSLAGEVFTARDFSGIRIPGADLSGAILDHTDFTGSDLRGVSFRNAYISAVRFDRSNMQAVDFSTRIVLKIDVEDVTERGVWSVSVSPDNKIMASGCYKYVLLWDMISGEHLSSFQLYSKFVSVSAFSPDNTLIACGSYGCVYIFEVQGGQWPRIISEHQGYVTSLAFNADGSQIVTTCQDCAVRVWDVKTGKRLKVLERHKAPPRSVSFNEEGTYLASGDSKGLIYLWSIADQYMKRIKLDEHTDAVEQVAFMKKTGLFVSASKDGSIRVWNPISRECVRVINDVVGRHPSIDCSTSGDLIVTTCNEKVHIIDLLFGRVIYTYSSQGGDVLRVIFSNDMKWLIIWNSQKEVMSHNIEQLRLPQATDSHCASVTSLAISPSGELLLSASEDQTLRLWNAKTGKCVHKYNVEPHKVQSIAIAPDGDKFVYGSDSVAAYMLSTSTGLTLQKFEGHRRGGLHVALSPDGSRLVTGGWDTDVRLWNVSTGACLEIFEGHKRFITAIAFHPDNIHFVTAAADKTVRLWSANGKNFKFWKDARGVMERSFDQVMNVIHQICFSPDGSLILSGGHSTHLRLWHVERKPLHGLLRGHDEPVYTVCFSPDGQYIASGSDDCTVNIWKAKTGKCFHTISTFSNRITGLVFSPNMKYLYVSLKSSMIYAFNLRPLFTLGRSPRLAWRDSERIRIYTATIRDVEGLSTKNEILLKCYGAKGEVAITPKSTSSSAFLWEKDDNEAAAAAYLTDRLSDKNAAKTFSW